MIYAKAFFDLQLQFAHKVAVLSGLPLARVLLEYTNLYARFGLGRDFDPEGPNQIIQVAGEDERHRLDAKERRNQNVMNFGYPSVLGILILAGDVWAIINIFQSSASNEKKLLWILVVALLPVLGLILWFFLGPRNGKT